MSGRTPIDACTYSYDGDDNSNNNNNEDDYSNNNDDINNNNCGNVGIYARALIDWIYYVTDCG